MAKSNLASMSLDALLKLRDDIGKVLSRKANELKHQLSRLGEEIGTRKQDKRSSLKQARRQIPRQVRPYVGGKRSNADLAAGEVERRCETGSLCCPQSTASSQKVREGRKTERSPTARGLIGKQVGNKKGARGNYIIG
jgi:hypothetical protein